MSLQRKTVPSRANGAKNRGANTPEVRRHAAADNLRQGLPARSTVLENENLQSSADLLNAIQPNLDPRNEIHRQARLSRQDPCTRPALAFGALSGKSADYSSRARDPAPSGKPKTYFAVRS